MKFNKLFGFLKRNNNGFQFLTSFAKFELKQAQKRILFKDDTRLDLSADNSIS